MNPFDAAQPPQQVKHILIAYPVSMLKPHEYNRTAPCTDCNVEVGLAESTPEVDFDRLLCPGCAMKRMPTGPRPLDIVITREQLAEVQQRTGKSRDELMATFTGYGVRLLEDN